MTTKTANKTLTAYVTAKLPGAIKTFRTVIRADDAERLHRKINAWTRRIAERLGVSSFALDIEERIGFI